MTFDYRRVSLNTTLKDARIFDDDSWEAENDFLASIKKEAPEEGTDSLKSEPIDDERNDPWQDDNALSIPKNIKEEIDDERRDPWESVPIDERIHPWQNDIDVSAHIKKEPFFDENARSPIKLTRSSARIKKEPVFDENTDSPMKQERIDFEMKLKFDTDESTNDNSYDDRKTNMRAARSNLKRRIEPYVQKESVARGSPSTPKKRLISTSSTNSSPENKKFKEDKAKRKKREFESDPERLRRRQKQIDYGKNTIGYDKYVKAIPKNQRERGDPQTPDKYRTYSRRGWDGLIKQWRLKLHKYDPA